MIFFSFCSHKEREWKLSFFLVVFREKKVKLQMWLESRLILNCVWIITSLLRVAKIKHELTWKKLYYHRNLFFFYYFSLVLVLSLSLSAVLLIVKCFICNSCLQDIRAFFDPFKSEFLSIILMLFYFGITWQVTQIEICDWHISFYCGV